MFSLLFIMSFAAPGKKKQQLADNAVTHAYNEQCHSDAKNYWTIIDSQLCRHAYGEDYILIDTNGLFVYSRSYRSTYMIGKMRFHSHVTKGYYSFGPCGEMFDINHYVIKREFKQIPEFVAAIKRIDNDSLIKYRNRDTLVLINVLYNNCKRH